MQSFEDVCRAWRKMGAALGVANVQTQDDAALFHSGTVNRGPSQPLSATFSHVWASSWWWPGVKWLSSVGQEGCMVRPSVRKLCADPTEGIHVLLGFLQPQLLVLWPSSMLGSNNKVCCTRLPDQAMKMLCPTNCKHLPCVRLGQASVPLSMLTPTLWTEPAQN